MNRVDVVDLVVDLVDVDLDVDLFDVDLDVDLVDFDLDVLDFEKLCFLYLLDFRHVAKLIFVARI